MIGVATAINSFAPVAQQNDFVPPSEQLITLTYGQLQDLVEKAVQPLQDRIESLEAIVARQGKEIVALEATQSTQGENELIQLQLINDLREAIKKDPQPLQKDRGEILRALLAANGGKMLATDARRKMHLSKQLFSMLIPSMRDYIEVKPLHSDNRKKLLILKTS